MKGWSFVYYEGENERPVLQADLERAQRIHDDMRTSKVISLGRVRMRRKLAQVPSDLKGPMALIHILGDMPQYKGARIEAIEVGIT